MEDYKKCVKCGSTIDLAKFGSLHCCKNCFKEVLDWAMDKSLIWYWNKK